MLYPLKFKPILKETIWGGQKLAGKSEDSRLHDHIGESWEISAVEDHISVVAEGALEENNLQELIEVYMGDLVGDKVYEKFGIEFPLLIKYIDAKENLSVQVHPDDHTAKERHSAYGKTEMWYVLDAQQDTQVIIGFKQDTEKTEYLKHLQQQTLTEILHTEKIKKGDAFLIPSGTVHGICKGCFLLEIGQTSDITYRLYDYDRKGQDGQPRELHTDLATEVIRFSKEKQYALHYHTHENHTEKIAACDHFTTNYLKFDQEIEKDYFDIDSFVIYVCLSGEFTLVYNVDKIVQVNKGETVLIPACLKNLFLLPQKEAEILEIYMA